MGKKAQKRSTIHEKGNAGWLRSFVSMFQFSQSYNLRKLLADRKYGSSRYSGTSFLGNNITEDSWERKYEHDANPDDCEDTTALSRLPSVKTLIEEEMSKYRTSRGSPCNIRSNEKTTKNHRNDSDPRINDLMGSAYVVLEQFKCREQVEGSNLIFDLAALMIEFYSVSRNCSDIREEIEVDSRGSLRSSGHRKLSNLDESDSKLASMFQEALVIEAEAFLSQKIDDTKRLVGDGVIHSQEFMDALEILNSNKELFLKLVQDPNSLAFRHVQELLKPQVAEGSDNLEEKLENSDQSGKFISNQTLQKKKDEVQGEIASKIRNTKEMSKIVVLKPPRPTRNRDGSTQNSKRTVSHFSFREIKRKLRYMIGDSRKEQHLISKDSFTRIPFGCKCSADTYSKSTKTNVISQADSSTENLYQADTKAEKNSKVKEWLQKAEAETARRKIQGLSPVSLVHAESFEEDEAEEHFSEIIGAEYRSANSEKDQIFKHLEEMISPSDCNMLKLQLIDDTSANLSQEQSLKEIPCLSGELDVKMPVINTEAASDKVSLQEDTCNGEQPKMEGTEEIVEVDIVKSVHINPPRECNTSCESRKDRFSTPSEQGTPNEKPRILIPTASISQTSLIINHFDSSEFIEKPERPSPVSVLQPFFMEDDASPDRPSIKLDESRNPVLQPIHLNFHEDSAVVVTASDCLIPHQRICSYDMEITIEYIRNMLESFSFENSEMSPERWPSSEQLDELNSLQSSCPEDPKLLLDCVNEVLSAMKDRRFTVEPILKDNIIQEVCEAMKRYLTSSQFQSTINEMMKKDMDGARWMDRRLEMECSVAEMGCSIFEELMEETIFELSFL